ncbi:tetratricopeptide repeat protein [Rhodospirillum rubrum]|uniref:tetratricopeptide repeat protein n=1 Tax=Rhodospirillum rubrum TaxID=1085 RepID=UPI0028A82ECD|nr:tetratricopeptide repeat protein [Rhodospirillum rubrum]
MNGTTLRGLAALWMLCLGLAACQSPGGQMEDAAQAGSPAAGLSTDLALAALAKGDYPGAETHVERALAANPQEPYALLAAGLLYQNTGRPAEAARIYRHLVALKPREQAAVGTWFRQPPQPIADIAAANLEVLGMLPATEGASSRLPAELSSPRMPMTPAAPTAMPLAMAPPPTTEAVPLPRTSGKRTVTVRTVTTTTTSSPAGSVAPLSAGPAAGAAAGGPVIETVSSSAYPVEPLSASGAPRSLVTPPSPATAAALSLGAPLVPASPIPQAGLLDPRETANIARRFVALRRLLAESLITEEEYGRRRAANLGALLPLTRPEPAADLGRPAPAPEEEVTRLKALRATQERGAMTGEQMAAERLAILEALLPADPRSRAPVLARPATATDGAAAEDRVAHLQNLGVISQAEARAEIAGIRKSVGLSRPTAPRQTAAASSRTAKGKSAAGRSAANGVHLDSYKSEADARAGWAALQKRHGALLSGLSPHIVRADLGKKGVFQRLTAGPLPAGTSAQALCARLKSAGQYCEPTNL